MAWGLNNDRPIYIQLVEMMEREIVSGHYALGAHLPSVRELALDAGVNPNTMQKAFAELEARGLVCTQRTAGRSITQDVEAVANIRKSLAAQETKCFLNNMLKLGFSADETLAVVSRTLKEDEK
ncbi:MAG: GntR family transcriptional regulator [Oscillospiraceae bacterium]